MNWQMLIGIGALTIVLASIARGILAFLVAVRDHRTGWDRLDNFC